MDRLETRELAYFVAVAEELHFGRAAERLGVAQPPLSRAIARLERRMGTRLLERTSRRVELTEAGGVLLTESRRVLDALDTAVRRTQRAARPDRLVLAVRPGAGAGLLLDLARARDGADFETVFTRDGAAALRDGNADIALMCAGQGDLSGLRTAELLREAPVALVPRNHRLARLQTVTVAELRKEAAFREACPPLGLDEIADRVALGTLVTVVGSRAADRLGRDVVAVPVADLPPTTVVLGWPRHVRRPEILAFVRTAQRLATAGHAVASPS
jgi:DNA-binding transcriptional LysR family regulator